MTRREEIVRKAMNSYPDCPERGFGTGDYEYPEFHDDEREAFIEGAKWADKTMLDKACDWMKEQVYQEYGGGPLERLIPDTRIEEFRKAMLE